MWERCLPVICPTPPWLLFNRLAHMQGNSNRIERAHNYALRMILQKPPRTSSAELRMKLNMKTLEHRCRINMIRQVHRCLLNQAPSNLSPKFSTNSSLGCTSTRGSSKIHLKCPVSEFYRLPFEFHGAKLYNELPESIRTINTTSAFRKALNKLY